MTESSASVGQGAADHQQNPPWQLKMFSKTLKKRQKLSLLLEEIGEVRGKSCVLITCGDNNGALNWHFKRQGGTWTWVDAEEESVSQISNLLGDPVLVMDKSTPRLDLPDDAFDVVVTIDVHEHLPDPAAFNREVERIVKAGGVVVFTTPNGDEGKFLTRVKKWIGMGPEVYGHRVVGFSLGELEHQMRKVGLEPFHRASYSHFFTEMIELVINFAYVKLLAKRSREEVQEGQIAPQNQGQLNSVGKTYRLYSLIYPLVWAVSQLDKLIAFQQGYAVVVSGRKPSR